MNFNLGLSHDIKTSQQLSLAPQLLQWLRILQSSTTDLSQMVQGELETNPALESNTDDVRDDVKDDPEMEAENAEVSEELTDMECESADSEVDGIEEKFESLCEIQQDWENDYVSAGQQSGSGSGSDGQERHQYIMDSIAVERSLSDHLEEQLLCCDIEAEREKVVGLIIGSLDERGYLSVSLSEISMLAGASSRCAEDALALLQSFDPAGVGARNLSECLLLQLADTEDNVLSRLLVKEYLEALGRGRFREVANEIGVSEEDVIQALSVIKKLSHDPGERFNDSTAKYISADVTVYMKNSEFVIELNDEDVPRLRISASCRNLLKKKKLTSNEMSYIRGKMRSAAFLIQGISQRQETLRRVAEQIVINQSEFLGDPDGALKPLTMARLAGVIGVHETTVSRALANKYMRTPRGLFPMKYFFKTGYRCADGSSLTPEAVKDIIVELIENEDESIPLRDIDIVAQLKLKGLRLARRTIAKYRDELEISSSKERKRANTLVEVDAQAA